jgi:hypothetical protein
MKKFWRVLGLSLMIIMLALSAGFLLWASFPAQPEQEALNHLKSNDEVAFKNLDGWLVFTPDSVQSETGLILYPGGRVDYRAYAPHAQAIASAGFTVVVVPMPLNFAFLGVNRASDVIETFPEIKQWAVGGHSLGGAMAAAYVSTAPSMVEGLVLWASYPAESNDLSNTDLSVISIYASNDGLATPQKIYDSKINLPVDTVFVEIEGGNHAGFGWYGSQSGDGESEIPKEMQQDLIVAATVNFLQSLDN